MQEACIYGSSLRYIIRNPNPFGYMDIEETIAVVITKGGTVAPVYFGAVNVGTSGDGVFSKYAVAIVNV